MIFGLIFGLGALCVLIYNCAVYAVPFGIGLLMFFGVLDFGGGYLSAIIIGFLSGVLSFSLFQFAISRVRSKAVRYLIVGVFVLPAAIAGYGVGFQISELAISSNGWQHIYAAITAIVVGYTAFVRLVMPTDHPSSDISIRSEY